MTGEKSHLQHLKAKEEQKMDTMKELNPNEMEQATGGTGGSKVPLPPKAGYYIYYIQRGDTLTRIAKRYGTTVEAIKAANSTIRNVNDITAGYYIYVPQ